MASIIVDLRPIEIETSGLTKEDIEFFNYGSLETQEAKDRHMKMDLLLHRLLYKELETHSKGLGWITGPVEYSD